MASLRLSPWTTILFALCFWATRRGKTPLPRRALQTWLSSIGEHLDDVNIIVRSGSYLKIKCFDIGTGRYIVKRDVPYTHRLWDVLPEEMHHRDMYLAPHGLKEVGVAVDLTALQKIPSSAVLNSVAPWGCVPGYIHFMIAPDLASGPRHQVFQDHPAKPPSSESKLPNVLKAQADKSTHIYYGRDDHLAMPSSLLDRTLAKHRHDIRRITPSSEDIQCYDDLCYTASQVYALDDSRQYGFSEVLHAWGVLPQVVQRAIGGYTDDGDVSHYLTNKHRPLYYVQAVKNEVGADGGDPYFKAIHFYQESVRALLAACEVGEIAFKDNEDLWKIHFPAVLVLHFGPYVDIAVAIFGDKLNVEHLTSFSVHAHPTNIVVRETGARALEPSSLYETLVLATAKPLSCAVVGLDMEGNRHELEYLEALEDTRVFRARTKMDRKPLVVKFSVRYCKEAHLAAFESGFAPKLYAVEHDWAMIVMEDKSADYTNLWDAEYMKGGKRRVLALEDVRAKVRDGLRSLHERGSVHGDVRDVNVRVRNATVAETEPAVVLVNWDRAGEKSFARYPWRMNCVHVKRPEDARPGEAIKEEHDMWMADRI